MANICDFEMKIKGTRKNCMEWVSRMESYQKEHHFYRVEPYIYDEEGSEEDYTIFIGGCCAWSLESCCRASGYSNGIDLFEVNTRELDIDMEAWSTEPGIGFQEHYLYKKGECLKDECRDYIEYYYDEDEYETLEDFLKEYDIEEFDENKLMNDYYCISFFENYGEYSI